MTGAKAIAAPLAIVALLATGCSSMLPPLQSQSAPVQGRGDPTAEPRTLDTFRHISVGGGLQVTATTGATSSVTVSAQPNLLPLIRTEVADDQLVVTVDTPGFSTSNPALVTIVSPEIDSLTLSGGADGTLEVVGPALSVDVSGGAALDATGRVDSLRLTASSGGAARLGGLQTGDVTVDLSGGASATLDASGAVTGSASGGASVTLAAKPSSVNVQTSGGASVKGG